MGLLGEDGRQTGGQGSVTVGFNHGSTAILGAGVASRPPECLMLDWMGEEFVESCDPVAQKLSKKNMDTSAVAGILTILHVNGVSHQVTSRIRLEVLELPGLYPVLFFRDLRFPTGFLHLENHIF